jgi:Protein of unknown function (DUF1572)
MDSEVETVFLSDTTSSFRGLKELAERALAQVSDDEIHRTLDDEANSIAVIMQHMAGNLRSRFTDFLTSDGEKPDRHRDAEFESSGAARAVLISRWEEGWGCLFGALAELRGSDLLRTVYIRAEPHTVVKALHRQLTHQAYHVGQIVLLARHFAGARWVTLSVPKGQSEAFNARLRASAAASGHDAPPR